MVGVRTRSRIARIRPIAYQQLSVTHLRRALFALPHRVNNPLIHESRPCYEPSSITRHSPKLITFGPHSHTPQISTMYIAPVRFLLASLFPYTYRSDSQALIFECTNFPLPRTYYTNRWRAAATTANCLVTQRTTSDIIHAVRTAHLAHHRLALDYTLPILARC